MIEKNPSLREFFLVVWRHWGPLMSGVFSVPFVGLSVFTESAWGKLIWGAMAFIAFVTSSYLVWANERRIVVGLRQRLVYKLTCSFSMNDAHCVRRDVGLSTGRKGDWYRVRVESITEANVDHCSARLLDVFRGNNPVFEGETPRLAFTASSNPFDITVYAKIPSYIDLLVIQENNEAGLALPTPDGLASINPSAVFTMAGDYTIRIAISSANAVTIVAKLLFQWPLDRGMAKITWLGTE